MCETSACVIVGVRIRKGVMWAADSFSSQGKAWMRGIKIDKRLCWVKEAGGPVAHAAGVLKAVEAHAFECRRTCPALVAPLARAL